MKTPLILALLLLTCLLACNPLDAQGDDPAEAIPSLDEAYEWLPITAPGDTTLNVYLTHAGDERRFVVEKPGRILVMEADGTLLESPFLDIREQVDAQDNEKGLLSVAFPPDYADSGAFYVNFTTEDSSIIARFQVAAGNPDQADPDSMEVLLEIPQPYSNHNGGLLKFGPDGYLYIGMGDGGSGGDPRNHGQNLQSYLGAMLRIDVAGESAYRIPSDNPFYTSADALPEIWAFGLRNPWRYSFDRSTGDLYIADVGQGAQEEINFQPADSPGGENYGWSIYEGERQYRDDISLTLPEQLVMPIYTYPHNNTCSVTGGYVYRGEALPELQGRYFFADYCSGEIWTLQQSADGEWEAELFARTDRRITSFGEDAAGELYLLTYSPSLLWKLEASAAG